MCREIESACKGSGSECVCLERERERDRERERERERYGKCVQRDGRSVFQNRERGSVCSDRERVCGEKER